MLTMTKSRIVNGKRVQETIEMTADEEADFLSMQAEFSANSASKVIDRKRKKLIDREKSRAINAMIAAEKAAIENMDEAALDAAIANL